MLFLIKANLSQLIKINLNHIKVVILLLQGYTFMLWVHQLPVHVIYKDTYYINTSYA